MILLIIIFTSIQVKGQIKYGKLKLKVIQNYNHYWNEISFSNNDTTIVRRVSPFYKRPIIDSIPQGVYYASMISDFGNKVSKKVIIRKNSKLRFKLKHYYQKDKSKKSFFNQLNNNDTLKIMSYDRGCFSFSEWGCIIFLKDSNWMTRSYNGRSFEYFTLEKEEIDRLKSIENTGRIVTKNLVYSTRSTRYSFVLDNKIIETRISGPSYIYYLFKNHNKLTKDP